jgi:hypothetical protein
MLLINCSNLTFSKTKPSLWWSKDIAKAIPSAEKSTANSCPQLLLLAPSQNKKNSGQLIICLISLSMQMVKKIKLKKVLEKDLDSGIISTKLRSKVHTNSISLKMWSRIRASIYYLKISSCLSLNRPTKPCNTKDPKQLIEAHLMVARRLLNSSKEFYHQVKNRSDKSTLILW